MFGAFKSTQPLLGGLLWKIPWRMSSPQKARQRKRLKAVDNVLSTLKLGLHLTKKSLSVVEANELNLNKIKPRVKNLRLLNKAENFPREDQMSSRDKYTVFNRYSKGYRKGIHKVPKWTKVSNRRNPKHF